MSPADPTAEDPWWASGRDPLEGLDTDEDPVDAHRHARRGETPPPGDPGDGPDPGADPGRLASDAIDLVSRLAAEVGRRVAARGTANAAGPAPGSFTHPDPEDVGPDAGGDRDTDAGWRRFADGMAPHEDGRVCDACPVCIGLRALRQVRPEVIGHLSDAAHHVSLALRAFADAQAGTDDDGLEKIDLDP